MLPFFPHCVQCTKNRIQSKEIVITVVSPGDEVVVPGNRRPHHKGLVFLRCYDDFQSEGDTKERIREITLCRKITASVVSVLRSNI